MGSPVSYGGHANMSMQEYKHLQWCFCAASFHQLVILSTREKIFNEGKQGILTQGEGLVPSRTNLYLQ